MNRVWVSELTINDGTTISLDKNDIVVFVGANNAGKSVSLKDIHYLLRKNDGTRKIIKAIKIEKDGGELELIDFFKTISLQADTENYTGYNFNIHKSSLTIFWNNLANGLEQIANVFVNILSTEARISAANPAKNIPITKAAPTHPIHFLQADDELEQNFSEYFHQAFGTDLILQRAAGSIVPFHVGKKPTLKENEDRLSRTYLDRLNQLPLLEEQGDGMRSFVGVLLYAFVSQFSIQLIDEPEAFLHPPQARLLGKMLAKDLPSDRQLFLATHSEDFLKGLLDSGNKNIKIIRVRRDGDLNKSCLLDRDELKQIWSEPLLRHSNIFSGLFHSRVILCEAAPDCTFYSAIVNSLYEDTNQMTPDLLFLHCGGKHKMPAVIEALKKLDVPISVITDFDILNDENPLMNIIEKLGGVWSDIKADWMRVKKSIDSKKPALQIKELQTNIETIFSTIPKTTETIPKESIRNIEKLLKKASPWAEAKTTGKNFIPNGEETQSFNRLNTFCKKLGLWIVEVGEMERFVSDIGGHGQQWVNEVLEKKNIKEASDLKIVKEFIQQLINEDF